MSDEIILGIDLGTTNSAACIYRDGKFEIIPSVMGYDYFPSVVAVNENGETVVGHHALKRLITNPNDCAVEFKLKMGTGKTVKFNGKNVYPKDLSSYILSKIKLDAEAYLNKKIKRAVISVPASFGSDARKATEVAGENAGFKVEAIINEPTAACLAYSIDKDIEGTVLVFDMGGGTLDITIGNYDGSKLSVESTVGARIGGRNITASLKEYVQNEFEKENNLFLEDYITDDYNPLVFLNSAVETAKIELSSTKTTKVHVPYIVMTDKGNRLSLDMEINRAKLNELSQFIVDKSEQKVKQALSEAKMSKEDIDYLVFVGGPTYMPYLRESIENLLDKPAAEGINPMLAVAEGASMYYSDDRIQVIEDINSLTLSLVGDKGNLEPLILKGAKLPAKKTVTTSTIKNNQTRAKIELVEGESLNLEDNHKLKSFILGGIPKGRAGDAIIKVTLEINEKGIMEFSAREVNSNSKCSVIINNDERMSEEEKEKAGFNNKKFVDNLVKKTNESNIINDANDVIFKANNLIKKLDSKLLTTDKEHLMKYIDTLDNLIKESSEFNLIELNTEKLSELINSIKSEEYYKNLI